MHSLLFFGSLWPCSLISSVDSEFSQTWPILGRIDTKMDCCFLEAQEVGGGDMTVCHHKAVS